MANERSNEPAELWARSFRTWTEAWFALAGQPMGTDAAAQDPIQLWRRSFDQWLEGWSALFEDTLSTPEVAASSGRLLDALLNIEKPLRQQTATNMQVWLEFFNLPSRNELLRVATQLNDTNVRLDELQQQMEDVTDRLDSVTAGADGARRAAGSRER